MKKKNRRIAGGRVLAIKLGSNPNSSSLGVDVTLLLGGGAVVSLLTRVGGTLARWVLHRRKSPDGVD